MRTLTCTIKFEDGNIVRVRASARLPDEEVPFLYAGDKSRFEPFAERGTLTFLQWYVQACAVHNNASLEISCEGEFSVPERERANAEGAQEG